MARLGLWDMEIARIVDTTDRLMDALNDIVPQTHASLTGQNEEEMEDEERNFFGDYAYDQMEIAEHATAAGKQIIPVVINSFLENWMKFIWKRTRGTDGTEPPRAPEGGSIVDGILFGFGLGSKEDDWVTLPGYKDATECRRVANGVKHEDGLSKFDVTLTDGTNVPKGNAIDYNKLRFRDYSVAVVELLNAVAKHARSKRTV